MKKSPNSSVYYHQCGNMAASRKTWHRKSWVYYILVWSSPVERLPPPLRKIGGGSQIPPHISELQSHFVKLSHISLGQGIQTTTVLCDYLSPHTYMCVHTCAHIPTLIHTASNTHIQTQKDACLTTIFLFSEVVMEVLAFQALLLKSLQKSFHMWVLSSIQFTYLSIFNAGTTGVNPYILDNQ